MGSPLRKLATPVPDSFTNEDGFRLMIETHRAYFRQDGRFEVHAVDNHEAFKYQYDLYGYLTAQGIHPEYHFVIMRLSDMESPTEFDTNTTVLYTPERTTYNRLKALYVTSRSKVVK